jgi:putative spermidine/putrescine transport system permease protein
LAAIYLLAPSGLIARILYHAGVVREPAGFPALWNDAHGLGIMCVYIAKEVPFLALLCVTVLVRLDPWLYDQARTIGASTWQRFRNITLPALLPVLAGGSAVVFAFVFSAFEVPLLAGRPFPAMMGVLAQQRFSGADLQDRPEALAMALLMFLIVAVVLATAFRVTRSFE